MSAESINDQSLLLQKWKDFIGKELGMDTKQFYEASLIKPSSSGRAFGKFTVKRPLVVMEWRGPWSVNWDDPASFVAHFEKKDVLCGFSEGDDRFGENFERLQGLLGLHSQTQKDHDLFWKTMTRTVFEWLQKNIYSMEDGEDLEYDE